MTPPMSGKPGVTAVALVSAIAFATACRAPHTFDEPVPRDIELSLFLIGDAGEPGPRAVGVPLESLTVQVAEAPQRSIVLFLGDNVYPSGIPEEGRAEYADSRRRLAAQVNAVPQGARAFFLPGNHDWNGEEAFGLSSIRLQEKMIATLAQGRDVRMV